MTDTTNHHTPESLEKLTFRELQHLIKSFKMSAQGDRENLTARILAAQASSKTATPVDDNTPVGDDKETPATDATPPDADKETPPEEDEKETPAADATTDDADKETPPVGETPLQEKEIYEPSTGAPALPLRDIAPRALRRAKQLIACYISVESYDKTKEDEVRAALQRGYQPCVVKTKAGFELTVFETRFVRADLSTDITPRRGGVLMNVSRRLADENLLPFGD